MQWIIILKSPEATWSFEEKVYEDEDKSIFVLFFFVSICLRRKHDGKGLSKTCLRYAVDDFREMAMQIRELSVRA